MALPLSPPILALFIAYLFDLKYVSAIGFSHGLPSLPDPTRIFYILQVLKGYHKKGFVLDNQLPSKKALKAFNCIIEASACWISVPDMSIQKH